MKVGTKSRYSVRLLVALARAGRQPVSLREVAATEGIPRPYLARLACRLREAGLVKSTRGVRGGYVLARPPHEVSLQEVVAAAEGAVLGVPCLNTTSGCVRVGTCAARGLWEGMSRAVDAFLRERTVADLLADVEGGGGHGEH